MNGRARKQLKRLVRGDQSVYGAVSGAIEGLANWPNIKDVKRLRNHAYGYRLRVGRYRLLFDVDEPVRVITVQEVAKRDERTY